MLRHNRLNNSSLEYLRPSPVRGQLEPQDPKTAKGWRYLQTTDTLDELKVSKGKKNHLLLDLYSQTTSKPLGPPSTSYSIHVFTASKTRGIGIDEEDCVLAACGESQLCYIQLP